MNIENAVVLVTGSNRGIGLAFCRALLARGARKVYAGARDTASVTLPGVHALRLDVTQPAGELAAYSASKAAAWSLTNALRHELAVQRTQVLALHMGNVDTALTRGLDAQKSSREDIVSRAFDGLEAGQHEVLADVIAQQTKQGMTAPTPSYLPQPT